MASELANRLPVQFQRERQAFRFPGGIAQGVKFPGGKADDFLISGIRDNASSLITVVSFLTGEGSPVSVLRSRARAGGHGRAGAGTAVCSEWKREG